MSFEHRPARRYQRGGACCRFERLNLDETVDGIPSSSCPLARPHLDEQAIIAAINPDKDVDGFHVINAGRLAGWVSPASFPCTPLGFASCC